ncbi:aminotransferase class I/II-fold pyridoxal phosphate-dependent enzyme [Saccharothrix deserti]|uniref:aminotransferase class I/II-fold pyridoxal phosphate-dependent enzyme n=1 Tax=Saccharothrix deserti TaxID=2593674 RepID=UPI00131E8A95|nr:aminotransferase class I/II-fold pyridoxal phosphate-dependent enzyme [Saccharothrix deserti]
MADVFDKCRAWTRVRDAVTAGIMPYGHVIEDLVDGTEAVVGGRKVVMLGSNDYLGLSADPRVKAAAQEAIDRYGTSCSGSRLLNGTRPVHGEFEQRIADFLGREAAVVTATGFQTNLAISTLLGHGDVVLTDRGNHASLVDAARLGFAEHRRYRHNDVEHLAWLLDTSGADRGKVIVTDSTFSIEGDLCDLPAIVRLAREHDARVVLDCAHDLGVLGAHGRGAPEHFGLESQVDLVTGTFSKAFGSTGGLIAGSREVVDFIRHLGHPAVYSAAMPPAAVAAADMALQIIEQEPERRTRLLDIAERLHNGLRALGFDTGRSTTHVVPVLIGDETLCLRFWTALLDAGVFTNAFVTPALPADKTMIRASVLATHTDTQLDQALEAFARVGRELGVIPATPPRTYEPVMTARPVTA